MIYLPNFALELLSRAIPPNPNNLLYKGYTYGNKDPKKVSFIVWDFYSSLEDTIMNLFNLTEQC